MNGSFLHRLELINLCTGDSIMPEWTAVFKDRANDCNIEMKKLVRRDSCSFEVFKKISAFTSFSSDGADVNRPRQTGIKIDSKQFECSNTFN